MGWGAAQALASEMGVDPNDAHDMLYGDDTPNHRRCPICSRKCKSVAGVSEHMTAKHVNPKHAKRIAAWHAERGL